MDCKCNMIERLVGDGCEVCNPAKALEYAKGTIDDTEESLKRTLAALRQMHDAFLGTSESKVQDDANDAAKALLDEFEA